MWPPAAGSVAALTQQEEQEERQLQAAREAFPGWLIRETFGGYLAVPKDTTIVQSTSLDVVVRVLREVES